MISVTMEIAKIQNKRISGSGNSKQCNCMIAQGSLIYLLGWRETPKKIIPFHPPSELLSCLLSASGNYHFTLRIVQLFAWFW